MKTWKEDNMLLRESKLNEMYSPVVGEDGGIPIEGGKLRVKVYHGGERACIVCEDPSNPMMTLYLSRFNPHDLTRMAWSRDFTYARSWTPKRAKEILEMIEQNM